MSHPRQADLSALVERLAQAEVELIIVGGAAAVLHGAPVTTIDLDVIHRQTPENVARLMTVLDELESTLRDPAGRTLRPTAALLMGNGQLNCSTTLGPLDALCRLHDGRGYEELVPHSDVLGEAGPTVRALDLATLIEIKASTGRAKDRLVVPVLLALQDEASSKH